MYKPIFFVSLLSLAHSTIFSQELFIFSDPASNLPSKSVNVSIGIRSPISSSNNYFKQRYTATASVGMSKNWMLRTSTAFSNFYSIGSRWETIRLYTKYRFFSKDEVHQHFRLAAFAQAAYTRNPFVYGELNLEGDNNGAQAGIIATQLLHKLAVGGSVSLLKVFAERNKHVHGLNHSLEAFSYSCSAGYLLFPTNYNSYEQTNINLYVECLGMKGLNGKEYMLDIAPGLQFIFNSNTKLNVGAKFQVASNMIRVGERSYFIGVEHSFLNVLRRNHL
jgi:hypothetical protein